MMQLLHGDCREVMATLPENSVDAIVTDPPYGLSFMGKSWDDLHKAWNMEAWHLGWATEAYRVLKPGGHLLAFGGSRTYHRLACAVEDAGFEIRDQLQWLYGSGFPKSHDVSKAMDRAAGVEREVVGRSARHVSGKPEQRTDGLVGSSTFAESVGMGMYETAPATGLARQWEGWGTALKPAHEPIVLARKPLIGTVAANVTEHGCGALNIDGCRIEGEPWTAHDATGLAAEKFFTRGEAAVIHKEPHTLGRWPANVLLDPEAALLLDAQSGDIVSRNSKNGVRQSATTNPIYGHFEGGVCHPGYSGESGGPSRFFYCAKASRAERNAGLEGMPERMPDNAIDRATQRQGLEGASGRGSLTKPMSNVHPCVKPIELMRWLARLITPPGGTVLDPFLGSGTTGIAAVLEGFDFIGIEQSDEYLTIAERRIAHVEKHGENWLKAGKPTRESQQPHVYASGKGIRTLARCPDHGASRPHNNLGNLYTCGCPVRFGSPADDKDPALDYGPLFELAAD